MKWISKYWWLIVILLIIFPFVLNLILDNKIDPITPKDWLMFWGSYISGGATIIVIFITLKNQQELKKLQLDILKNNKGDSFIRDLISDIELINKTFNPIRIIDIINHPNEKSENLKIFRNNLYDTPIWFFSKYLLEIRDNKIITDYYTDLKKTYAEVIDILDLSDQVYLSFLPKDTSVKELKVLIEKQKQSAKIKESIITTQFWNEIYNQLSNCNIVDGEVEKCVNENSRIKNFEKQLIDSLISNYTSLFHEFSLKGAKLIRIEKEKLNSIFEQHHSEKEKTDDDLPF